MVSFTIAGTKERFNLDYTTEGLTPRLKKKYRVEVANKLHDKYVPLHAVLLKGKKNILISGSSGSGKSTLGERLKRDGYKVLANDFVVVWENNGQLFAGDLNLSVNNINKKSISVDSVYFLSLEDPRDVFSFSDSQFKEFYENLFDIKIKKEKLKQFYKTMTFLEIFRRHSVLGNRQSVERWQNMITPKSSELSKVGIVGVGTVGTEVASLLLTQNWIKNLNLSSPNAKKLESVVLDLRSANPDVKINICDLGKIFGTSNIVILAFKTGEKKTNYKGERMMRLESNVRVIWQLSRVIRKQKFGGYVLVVTNPVDTLCMALYRFSNMDDQKKLDWEGLTSNQIFGIGLGLDYKRMKTLTKQGYELAGDHGDNIVLAKKRGKVLKFLKDESLLREIKNYSPRIREYVERTVYGPAHEVLDVLQVLNKKKGILRVSTLNEDGVFLGGIFDWLGSQTSPHFMYSLKLRSKLKKVTQFYRKIYKGINI